MTPALDMVAVSDRGMVRAGNEDSVAVNAGIGLAVLADGMGGHNAGEVASGMAVDLVVADALDKIDPAAPLSAQDAQALVAGHVAVANARVHAAGAAARERAGMGTTIVVALWHDTSLTLGHVGDSRCYRLRGYHLTQLTRDHTLVQEGVDRGALTLDQARLAASRNILTRALGTEPEVAVDLDTLATRAEDVYLLCSDGLTEMLDDSEIAAVIVAFGATLRVAADELVRRANANGGVDNVSVILVRQAASRTAAAGLAAATSQGAAE
jgi:protein phosphatase